VANFWGNSVDLESNTDYNSQGLFSVYFYTKRAVTNGFLCVHKAAKMLILFGQKSLIFSSECCTQRRWKQVGQF